MLGRPISIHGRLAAFELSSAFLPSFARATPVSDAGRIRRLGARRGAAYELRSIQVRMVRMMARPTKAGIGLRATQSRNEVRGMSLVPWAMAQPRSQSGQKRGYAGTHSAVQSCQCPKTFVGVDRKPGASGIELRERSAGAKCLRDPETSFHQRKGPEAYLAAGPGTLQLVTVRRAPGSEELVAPCRGLPTRRLTGPLWRE